MAKYNFNIDYIIQNVVNYYVRRYVVINGIPSEAFFRGDMGRFYAATLAEDYIRGNRIQGLVYTLDEEDLAAIRFVNEYAAKIGSRLFTEIFHETGEIWIPMKDLAAYIKATGIRRQ